MKFDDLYRLVSEKAASRPYSCLMLDMGFLSKELSTLQQKICPCDVYDDEDGHGLEDEFHCTVLYGIHTENLQEVRNAVNLRPVKFTIGKLSLFENEKYDVLKFEIRSKELHRLNAEARDNLANTNSYPIYKPHSTVGYLHPGTGSAYLKTSSGLIGKTFTSNTFIFSDQSHNKVTFSVT